MNKWTEILQKATRLVTDHLRKDLSMLRETGVFIASWFGRSKKTLLAVFGTLLTLAVFFVWILEITPFFADRVSRANKTAGNLTEEQQLLLKKELASAQRSVRNAKYQAERLEARGNYLVINTNENHFYLYRGNRIVRDGMCSTGSYTLLKGGENQQWVFKTPKGMFRIQGKREAPVWKKPDWAFVEEGLPIPSENHPSRFEYGVLGDYALALGDGYLIHGTLYKRFLGLPVTHGCVRLNDDDLYSVYITLEPGSKVFIF